MPTIVLIFSLEAIEDGGRPPPTASSGVVLHSPLEGYRIAEGELMQCDYCELVD